MDEFLNALIGAIAQSQGQSQRFDGQRPNKSQEPQRQPTGDVATQIKTNRDLAEQYFQQALRLKQEADKLEAAEKAKKIHFEEDLRPIPAVKYNNKVERFAREQDANNYVAFLIENGACADDIETFNIDINMNPRFWRA